MVQEKTEASTVSTARNEADVASIDSSAQKGHVDATKDEKQIEKKYKWEIVWHNVIGMIILHTWAVFGLIDMLTGRPSWKTTVWAISLMFIGSLGATAGAHRLWSHRSYKAKMPFQLLLALLQTISMQNSIYIWAREHRVHHKFTDTDGDPHNSKRGFFFCHIGWLMLKKQKVLLDNAPAVNMNDLKADPLVMFQHRYYYPLALFWGLAFPVWVPMYFWNECFMYALSTAIFRYVTALNGAFCINSVAHMFGTKPYDKNIMATQNKAIGLLVGGEGWHNYHHVFPFDYRSNEFNHHWMNHSTALIDWMAAIGWAYDLKTAKPEIIKRRLRKP